MLIGALLGMIASMVMVIIRAIVGPTIFDRILAVNSFGTNVVVFIVLLQSFIGTGFFLDIAITYALINFIATVALSRYFMYANSEGEK